MFVFVYPSALRDPIVTVSSTNTRSIILSLSQPTSTTDLQANEYTAILTSSVCPSISSSIETTTTPSVMISNLEAGIQYTVTVIANHINTGSTSAAMTTVTTQEESTYMPNKVLLVDFYLL